MNYMGYPYPEVCCIDTMSTICDRIISTLQGFGNQIDAILHAAGCSCTSGSRTSNHPRNGRTQIWRVSLQGIGTYQSPVFAPWGRLHVGMWVCGYIHIYIYKISPSQMKAPEPNGRGILLFWSVIRFCRRHFWFPNQTSLGQAKWLLFMWYGAITYFGWTDRPRPCTFFWLGFGVCLFCQPARVAIGSGEPCLNDSGRFGLW